MLTNILFKLFTLLLVIYSSCYAKGGKGGSGGHSRGSHNSLVKRSFFSTDSKSNSSISNNPKFYNNIVYGRGTNDILFIIAVIFAILVNIILLNKFSNKSRSNMKKEIKANVEKYCENFLEKFRGLNNIPSEYDIIEAYNNIGVNALNDVLTQLIINKIKIIDNLSIYEQYNIFYKQNIDKIDLFQLANNTISISKIEQIMGKNTYMKIKFASSVEKTNGYYNEYLLNNYIINLNSENILRIYLNQKLIFKEIILKIFTEDNKEYENIKVDILKQINDYTYMNILNDKKQLLVNAFVDNIIENKIFKNKVLNKLESKTLLNLINNIALLIKNCENEVKVKKYKKLLEDLSVLQ